MLPALRASSSRSLLGFSRVRHFSTPNTSEPVTSWGEFANTLFDSPPSAGSQGFAAPRRDATRRDKGLKAPQKLDLFANNVTRLRLHCQSSPNNTMTTLTDADGGTIAWFSGGSCGFKKGNRATYEAGYQCAVRVFQKIEQLAKNDGAVKVDMLFKGFGQGREALKGALLSTEGERIRPLIASITDRTPIKIGGTRAKKMPRN
ncbi:hypothetical protein EST38_g665 [Candolleomyces aberdarensis]|uniref:Translational machinery component n=1 Tax=Candolleomyces aberdarensis TaxID=2316362 RepID=A0A4V1Q5C9_9AGAR|nr:hypothetical protein EST38_g665 [Candolleomyces aberdarensis]